MSTSQSDQINRSYHLGRLDRSLHRIGNFGTALIDPDDELDDTWTGLLIWNIEHGAQAGIIIRCNQELPTGKWNYCHNDGTIITDVSNPLAIIQELTNTLVPTVDRAQS